MCQRFIGMVLYMKCPPSQRSSLSEFFRNGISPKNAVSSMVCSGDRRHCSRTSHCINVPASSTRSGGTNHDQCGDRKPMPAAFPEYLMTKQYSSRVFPCPTIINEFTDATSQVYRSLRSQCLHRDCARSQSRKIRRLFFRSQRIRTEWLSNDGTVYSRRQRADSNLSNSSISAASLSSPKALSGER